MPANKQRRPDQICAPENGQGVTVGAPAKENTISHGARPLHLVKWIRTSRLSMKNSLSVQVVGIFAWLVGGSPTSPEIESFPQNSVLESQLPHKIVNLLLTITNLNIKLKVLWGS